MRQLFSHPYKLWDDERRTSITAEGSSYGRRWKKQSESSQVRAEGEDDGDVVTAVDLDMGHRHSRGGTVEVVMKEEKTPTAGEILTVGLDGAGEGGRRRGREEKGGCHHSHRFCQYQRRR